MRICVKIAGRWIRSTHFLNGEVFDKIMLIVLNSNSFSVYEDGKLIDEYKIDDVTEKEFEFRTINIILSNTSPFKK